MAAPKRLLAVFHSEQDCAELDRILGSAWVVSFRSSPDEATRALRSGAADVVLTDSTFAEGRSWKDLLHALQAMTNPPPLVVADTVADERMWAEVLNLGGFDLLARPLEYEETHHVLEMASHARTGGRKCAVAPGAAS